MVVDGLIFADGEEPGGNAVGVEGGEGGGEFDEGVLDDVAGVFEVGGEGEGVADERALEAVQQGFEGRGRGAHVGQVQGASRVGRDFYWGAMKKNWRKRCGRVSDLGFVSVFDASGRWH